LGKNPVLVDMSLETAEEVERMGAMERSRRNGIPTTIDEDGRPADDDELEGQRQDNKQVDKAFGDMTDLENEDFLFVF
jgi:hypothetical protein